MADSKSAQASIIGLMFALLSISAATGFPRSVFDPLNARGLRMLDGIVTTVGTGPFGPMGGALLFAALGVLFVWLVLRKPAGERRRAPDKRNLFPEPKATAEASLGRKRVIGAAPQPAPWPALQPQPAPQQTPAAMPDYLQEMMEIATQEREAGPVPAWALLLRSPYVSWDHATSWLGGAPKAPPGFQWPRDGDGRAQHFLAQIDLASIGADPETGERPANLPERGAMLVFAGTGQAVRVISGADMARAQTIVPPADLSAVESEELGYWGDGNAFTRWPIDLLPYLSDSADMDEESDDYEGSSAYRPSLFPKMFEEPQDWITNWAIAAIDADVTITALENELRTAETSRDYRARQAEQSNDKPQPAWKATQNSHQDMMLAEAPAVLAMLREWRDHIQAQHPDDPVDPAVLKEVFARRIALQNRMKGNYGSFHILGGSAYEVWSKLKPYKHGTELVAALRALPPSQQGFAESIISDWRNHRLFGIEPPFPNNGEDLRGYSCLISISADALLGTQSEHDYGLSVWFKREDLAAGRFDGGMLVRHCAV